MPRHLRIEYPGALYHVLNRGNYRRDVFATDGNKQAFERTVFAACERCGWVLHAYCLMDNHYHLAVETPQPNLSRGMQWLQATYANRFNRLVKDRGHLFQGRFKSLIVDRDAYLGPLLHYLHLNPVRAGAVSIEALRHWRWSSLWYLFRKRLRPACLNVATCLYTAGHLADTPAGRKRYLAYLDWLLESDERMKSQKADAMSRGWALGTKPFKKDLLENDRVRWVESVGRESAEARQLVWEGLLDKMLAYHAKSGPDAEGEKKSALWKVMIAHVMKTHTDVTNGWLSEHLHMGTPRGVSRYVAAFERAGRHRRRDYKRMIAQITT